jgi:hypothetical protein
MMSRSAQQHQGSTRDLLVMTDAPRCPSLIGNLRNYGRGYIGGGFAPDFPNAFWFAELTVYIQHRLRFLLKLSLGTTRQGH